MRLSFVIALTAALACPAAAAQSIYKCKTADGIIFSGKPCGDDAVKLSEKRSGGTTSATRHQTDAGPASVDIGKFEFLPAGVDAIIAQVGPPAASYTSRGTEHWLYPNAVRVSEGERTCPELLIEDGQMFQITWLPEAIMRKSIVAARAIAGWERSGPVADKAFLVSDTGVVGDRKASVERRFGQPDAKKIFNGREVWEYERVKLAANGADTLTILIEFEGDVVANSVGN